MNTDPGPPTSTILVVDDSASYRLLLSAQLRKFGYETVQAENAEQALDILKREDVRLVVSDWEMPGLKGIDLCRQVREAGLSHYVYFILVTARGEAADLIAGMEAGADDFLRKPIDQQELRVRIRAGERLLDMERRLEQRNRELKDAYEVIERDLRAAQSMQMALLPANRVIIDRLRGEWLFLPSMFVSGDMHGCFRLDEQHLAFYSIDVCGHGVKAAMLSVTISRHLSREGRGSILKRELDAPPFYTLVEPAEVLAELNDEFQQDGTESMFFTMVYGVVDTQTGEGVLARAGHPLPLVVDADGASHGLPSGGPPLGILPGISFSNERFLLKPGSRLYVYTDGIIECDSPEQALYGAERLTAVLCADGRRTVSELLQSLEQDLIAWRGVAYKGFNDDVSMLVLECMHETESAANI